MLPADALAAIELEEQAAAAAARASLAASKAAASAASSAGGFAGMLAALKKTPAPSQAPAPAVAVQADAAESSDSSMAVKLNVFGAKLQQLAGLFSSVKTDFKTLEKMVSRELKNAQKTSSKRKKSGGNRQPSGFVKPTRISDELAHFLGKTVGTEMARTEVSREINAYIRSNGLQDKANGRKINADSKLSTLLKLNKEDELTYFNLQRYMKHHFIKAEAVASA